MKTILVMVTSVDGKSTRSFDRADASPNFWASPEDQAHFEELKKNAQVIVMGRKTYDAAKAHIKDDDKKMRIVMSRATHDPRAVIADLEKQGITEILLVGGSELNAAFFKENLINEIYLTIEPKIFGEGLPLAQGIPLEVELRLLKCKQINPQGTLLLHYRIV